jgi:hypothetical protein
MMGNAFPSKQEKGAARRYGNHVWDIEEIVTLLG